MNNYSKGEMTRLLKRGSVVFGLATALLSIYFSYDGLDQTVGEMVVTTSDAAKYVGVFVALLITLLQFIFNTNFNQLNLTLKVLGATSYAYSIYTNFKGIEHIFGFDIFICWFFAGIMDILPESLIAWGLDEHLQGDFLGNLVKIVLGDHGGSQKKQYAATAPNDTQPRMKPIQHQNQPRKGQGRTFLEQQRNQHKSSRFAGFEKKEDEQ